MLVRDAGSTFSGNGPGATIPAVDATVKGDLAVVVIRGDVVYIRPIRLRVLGDRNRKGTCLIFRKRVSKMRPDHMTAYRS